MLLSGVWLAEKCISDTIHEWRKRLRARIRAGGHFKYLILHKSTHTRQLIVF